MPTMKDVARLAGVSQPTVSHVINGTASISDAVVKRVHEAIERLGYVPNAAAKSLKTSKTRIIGVLVPDVGIRYYSEMVKSLEVLLRDKGYMVFLCNTFYSTALERAYVQTLIQHNVLGVIAGFDLADQGSVALLREHRIPAVTLDSGCADGTEYRVRVDNEKLARIAVSHLYDTGARCISYCSEPMGVEVLQARYVFFQKALQELGLEFEEKRCFIAHNPHGVYDKMERGYQAGANLLLHEEIDAVFASSDEFAFGIISRLKEHGVAIPQRMPILGCDNDPFSVLMDPPLTTVWQPIARMAETGVNMLLKLTDGDTVAEKDVCLEPELIIRESTLKMRAQSNATVSVGPSGYFDKEELKS